LLALRVPYLAEAEANIEQAKAEVERARVKLEKTRIKAPYDGIISRKNVDIGQFVSAGIPLAETFAVDFVEIRLPLSDQDLSKMSDSDFTDALRGKKVKQRGSSVLSSRRIARNTWLCGLVIHMILKAPIAEPILCLLAHL
jgi:multidrug efflux pump subunit AcrA (membrane-fusion protein)